MHFLLTIGLSLVIFILLNNLVLQSSAESNGYVDLSIVLDFPRVQALFEQSAGSRGETAWRYM